MEADFRAPSATNARCGAFGSLAAPFQRRARPAGNKDSLDAKTIGQPRRQTFCQVTDEFQAASPAHAARGDPYPTHAPRERNAVLRPLQPAPRGISGLQRLMARHLVRARKTILPQLATPLANGAIWFIVKPQPDAHSSNLDRQLSRRKAFDGIRPHHITDSESASSVPRWTSAIGGATRQRDSRSRHLRMVGSHPQRRQVESQR